MTRHLYISFFCDTVYLKMNSDTLQTFDLNKQLEAVAKRHIVGDGLNLINADTGKVCEKKTKKFIVGRTQKYILGLPERLCPEENMAQFVSLTQMQKLIYALSKKGRKEISCYSFVYIYIIYTLLDSNSEEARECIEIMRVLYDEIQCFYDANPTNQLAAFLIGCYTPIIQALYEQNKYLAAADLPAVPRKQVYDD